MKINSYIFIILSVVILGCSKSKPSVKLFENLDYFNRIELEDSFEIHLIEGSTFTIRIEGDEDVIDKVEYEILDSVLSIKNTRSIKWVSPRKNKIKVYITSLPLEVVAAHQTCYITTDTPITSDEFGLEFHGKANEANLELNGNIFYYWNNFQCGGKLTLSGSTNVLKLWNFAIVAVEASSLTANNAIVENSSKGDCIIKVNNKLDYAITGDGNIYLYGNPPIINETEVSTSQGQLIQY